MITIHAAMLVILGFLLAALLLLVFLPAYRRRIERFSTETLKRALPLTEAEIRADKDRIRAEYAIEVHKLEMKMEEAGLSAARQSVEINRREAKIHELELAIDAQKSFVEEHENARRVLEQAIMDRLPKVEQRLAEARKLLVQRDREIAALTDSSAKQTAAIEEATQINIQQAGELHRVRAALETRAARNRETLGDARFDGEVALRSEIEALRAKTRDQSALLERFQAGEDEAKNESRRDEVQRLNSALAKAEAELADARSAEGSNDEFRTALEDHVRNVESKLGDQTAEIARLKASLKAYEETASETHGGHESRISSKAEINSLQAEVDEQRKVIQALKSEVAGSNERLARQAQHFRDEMRRLGGGAALPAGAAVRAVGETPRRSLAERIAQPRVAPKSDVSEASEAAPAELPSVAASGNGGEHRQSGFLRAVNGKAGTGAATQSSDANGAPAAGGPSEDAAEAPPRRSRLLDRISNIEKS